MKLRRGCGCPVVLLGLANVVYIIAAILSMVRNTTGSPWGPLLILGISLANAGVCVVVALAAFRSGALEPWGGAGQEGLEEGEESTAEDVMPPEH